MGDPGQAPADAAEGGQGPLPGEVPASLALVTAVSRQNEKFTEEEMHNYRMAVTEREVGKAQW